MPDGVVFWDIDGTLLPGSLEGGFVSYLRRHGQLDLWRILRRYARQMMRLPLPVGYQFKLAYLRREPVGDVEHWIDSYWTDDVLGRLYPDVRLTVDQFYAHGFRQVLLSGTIYPLARRLGDYLGINDIIAAEPEVIDGAYTGGLKRPHPAGPRKSTYAEEWLKARNLGFDSAVAPGNHFSDRDLLSRVLVPVAVNPSDRLRTLAARTGWPIVERPAELLGLVEAIAGRFRKQ